MSSPEGTATARDKHINNDVLPPLLDRLSNRENAESPDEDCIDTEYCNNELAFRRVYCIDQAPAIIVINVSWYLE